MAETDSTPERKKLPELDADGLRAIYAALLALVEDEEIPTEVREKENITRLSIGEWLKKRNASSRLEGAKFLSVPNFYLNSAQVARIQSLTDIDDFPVLEPDDLTYVDKKTGVSMHRRDWQTSLFALDVRVMGLQHTAHLYVQPGHSKWAYTSGEKILVHTDAWDSNGRFSPPMKPEVVDFIEVLKAYGDELQNPDAT